MKRKSKKENKRNKIELGKVVNEKGFLDYRESAQYLKCTVQNVHLLVKRGHLTPVSTYFGNTLLFTKKMLDTYNKTHNRFHLNKKEQE